MEQELVGDDPATGHILEGENGISVLVICAAADAGLLGGVIDGSGLTGGQQVLVLCHLQKYLRKGGCLYNVVFGIVCHSCNLLILCKTTDFSV